MERKVEDAGKRSSGTRDRAKFWRIQSRIQELEHQTGSRGGIETQRKGRRREMREQGHFCLSLVNWTKKSIIG